MLINDEQRRGWDNIRIKNNLKHKLKNDVLEEIKKHNKAVRNIDMSYNDIIQHITDCYMEW